MQIPSIEALQHPSLDFGYSQAIHVGVCILLWGIFLRIVHSTVAKLFKREYFTLHVIANSIIVFLCADGVVALGP